MTNQLLTISTRAKFDKFALKNSANWLFIVFDSTPEYVTVIQDFLLDHPTLHHNQSRKCLQILQRIHLLLQNSCCCLKLYSKNVLKLIVLE